MELNTLKRTAEAVLDRGDTRAPDRLVAALVLDYIKSDQTLDAEKLILRLVAGKLPRS